MEMYFQSIGQSNYITKVCVLSTVLMDNFMPSYCSYYWWHRIPICTVATVSCVHFLRCNIVLALCFRNSAKN